MSAYDLFSLAGRAQASELGESVQVLYSRPFCRISLVVRKGDPECSLLLEAVARYDLPLSPTDSSLRRGLMRRLGRFGFLLVQENGCKVYELNVQANEIDRVMAGLIKGWLDHSQCSSAPDPE